MKRARWLKASKNKEMIEKEFDMKLSNKFNIHRTRKNFPNKGIDTFENMAKSGVKIVEKVILEELGMEQIGFF